MPAKDCCNVWIAFGLELYRKHPVLLCHCAAGFGFAGPHRSRALEATLPADPAAVALGKVPAYRKTSTAEYNAAEQPKDGCKEIMVAGWRTLVLACFGVR